MEHRYGALDAYAVPVQHEDAITLLGDPLLPMNEENKSMKHRYEALDWKLSLCSMNLLKLYWEIMYQ